VCARYALNSQIRVTGAQQEVTIAPAIFLPEALVEDREALMLKPLDRPFAAR